VDSYVQEGMVLTNTAQVTYTGGSKTSSVSVDLGTIYTVHVGVYNEAGELVKEIWVKQMAQQVREFDVADNPDILSLNDPVHVVFKGKKIATWDGTNANGDPVSNGKYYLKVDNVDAFGVVNSVSNLVMVSRSIARIQVNIFNSAGEIIRHLYSVADDPGNLSLVDVQVSSSVIRPTQDGVPVAGANNVVQITSLSGVNMSWDGKSDTGSIVTNGHYEIEVHYVDGRGGEQVFSRGVIVQSTNTPITDGKAYVAPNILKDGQTTAIVKVNSATAFTLTATLYDVAGERVSQPVTGPTGAKQAPLDVSGLASGIYFVVVELRDLNGGLAGRQVTQIVVQH